MGGGGFTMCCFSASARAMAPFTPMALLLRRSHIRSCEGESRVNEMKAGYRASHFMLLECVSKRSSTLDTDIVVIEAEVAQIL